MLNKTTFFKTYAMIWLGVALAGLAWTLFENMFTQAPGNMALGIFTFFFGWGSIVVGLSAALVLWVPVNVFKLLGLVLLTLLTSVFLLSVPLLAAVCLLAGGYAIYSANSARK